MSHIESPPLQVTVKLTIAGAWVGAGARLPAAAARAREPHGLGHPAVPGWACVQWLGWQGQLPPPRAISYSLTAAARQNQLGALQCRFSLLPWENVFGLSVKRSHWDVSLVLCVQGQEELNVKPSLCRRWIGWESGEDVETLYWT